MGECLFATGAIVVVLLLVGYLIFTIVAASYDDCLAASSLPPDSMLNLSMQDWLVGQLITSLIVMGIFSGFAKAKSSSSCMVGTVAAVVVLYILFEEVWSIIGLVLFKEYYEEACQNAENFNTYVAAEIISGLTICSLILLIAIVLACRQFCPSINWRPQSAQYYQPPVEQHPPVVHRQPILAEPVVSDQVAATPHNPPQMTDEQLAESQSALMYLYNRISRSKDEPNERYSRIN